MTNKIKQTSNKLLDILKEKITPLTEEQLKQIKGGVGNEDSDPL